MSQVFNTFSCKEQQNRNGKNKFLSEKVLTNGRKKKKRNKRKITNNWYVQCSLNYKNNFRLTIFFKYLYCGDKFMFYLKA